jgi:Ca2+-binding EF-hand superfamily protein
VALTAEDISHLDVTTSSEGKGGAGNVEVRYSEFATLLKDASLSRDHSDDPDKQQLRSKVLDNGVTIWQVFQKYDAQHLGWVEQKNVAQVFDSFSIAYSKHEFRKTISLYEKEEDDGRFHYGEFCNVVGRKGANFGTSM